MQPAGNYIDSSGREVSAKPAAHYPQIFPTSHKLSINAVVEDATEALDTIRGMRDVQGNTLNPMQGKADKAIYTEWNEARNHLKHHNMNEQSTVKLNLFDEAYWMIKRALVNAGKANVGIPNEQEFENWIIININI